MSRASSWKSLPKKVRTAHGPSSVDPIAETAPITTTAIVSLRSPARNASRSPAPRCSDSSGTSVAWIAWKK
jgi:hypothetical protein